MARVVNLDDESPHGYDIAEDKGAILSPEEIETEVDKTKRRILEFENSPQGIMSRAVKVLSAHMTSEEFAELSEAMDNDSLFFMDAFDAEAVARCPWLFV